jgi:hypothetical protein
MKPGSREAGIPIMEKREMSLFPRDNKKYKIINVFSDFDMGSCLLMVVCLFLCAFHPVKHITPKKGKKNYNYKERAKDKRFSYLVKFLKILSVQVIIDLRNICSLHFIESVPINSPKPWMYLQLKFIIRNP